jgi:serine/threonine-protein kinase
LPEEFASDRDRLARFQREARLLAALNHPNIAHIHEMHESDGVQFLVMELVEGETLADRILGGPLPLENVLKYFVQIADGLEAAHQQGVIHRDLKPANIKITDEGKVSVLDFGLAKALEPASAASNDAVTSPWNNDSDGKSIEGQVLGTPAYMSPEQARGKPLDKRTDIWAFGCCLYKSLTGKRPFQGETGSDTLARILTADPGWEKLPDRTPPRLRELLKRCLAKEVRGRLRDIGDAGLELAGIASNPDVEPMSAPKSRFGRWRLVAAMLLCLIVGSLMTGATVWSVMRPDALPNHPVKGPQGVVRFTHDLPPETAININPVTFLYTASRLALALSPDGSRLVYAGGKAGGETMLYLHPMDRLETSPLSGTQGAESPFFSPDGQSVGFFAGGKLKKIRVEGSQPVVLCDAQNPMGATWARDGMIYFAETPASILVLNRGLKRIRDSGGDPEWLTHNEGDPNVSGHAFPCALPDGQTVLFTLAGPSSSKSSIAALSLKTGQWKAVLPHADFARYVPTGHLLFHDQGWFYAACFDTNRLQVSGPRVPLLQSPVLPALSNTGCFVHGPSESREGQLAARPLVWVTRQGKTERLKALPRPYSWCRLSLDGKRLATSIYGERGNDIWIHHLERQTDSRLTFEGLNVFPVWTPDGRRVVFASARGGKAYNLFSLPADGSAQPQRLTHSEINQFPHTIRAVSRGSSAI